MCKGVLKASLHLQHCNYEKPVIYEAYSCTLADIEALCIIFKHIDCLRSSDFKKKITLHTESYSPQKVYVAKVDLSSVFLFFIFCTLHTEFWGYMYNPQKV